jgi:hypothetical protein
MDKTFKVNKEFVFQLTMKLKHLLQKNTRYQFVITIGIRVACSFYKLPYGVGYLQHSEIFAIGKSIVHVVMSKFVVNVVCRNQIQWLKGEELAEIVAGFKNFCGLPSFDGAINVTHIHIQKPIDPFIGDYYSFKFEPFNMQL